MKKLLLATACLLACTGTARAGTDYKDYFHPYVGTDLTFMHVKYNDSYDGLGVTLNGNDLLNQDLYGLNLHVGNRFTRYFGAELGYMHTTSADKTVHAGDAVGPGTVAATDFKTKVKTQQITLDGFGYLPLDPKDQVDLIGTAGISWTKADIALNVPGLGGGSDDQSEFGWRGGAGAQVNITPQVALRGLVRYQSADFDDVADHAIVYTLGLNYSF
jgi:opacity protein-like surface antigen